MIHVNVFWCSEVLVCEEMHSTVAINSVRFLHELSRYNYVTPTSYLELLRIFNKLLLLKTTELNTAINRTKGGLDKVERLIPDYALQFHSF